MSDKGSPGRRRRASGLTKVVVASAGALLVVVGLVYVVKRSPSREGSASAASSTVDRAEVTRGSFEITTTATGELEARNQIELRSQLDTMAGIVEIVPEGSVVRKGDVLVRLNAEELQDQIDQQELEVDRARADATAAENEYKIQQSENESKRRAGELEVALAELALRQWSEGDDRKMKEKLDLDIAQAEREVNRLRDRFQRSESLLLEGFLSKDERDQDEIAFINAQAGLRTAQLDKQVYLDYQFERDQKTKQSDLDEAKADLDRVLSENEINLAQKQTSLDTARLQLTRKEEKLSELQEQVAMATITAPADGLVVYATSIGRNRDFVIMGGDGPLQVGREVRPNEPLIILPDTSSMIATVRVHESLAGRLRPGLPALVTVEAVGGQSYSGKVESIGVLAEQGGWRDPNRREYSVRIAMDFDNSDGRLKPSMRAEGAIMLGRVEEALMVPVQAVFAEGPVRYICRPRGARFERVPVKVGRMSDAFAEVLAGVAEGDDVLLRDPEPGELSDEPWGREALELAGVSVDEQGNPVAPAQNVMMMPAADVVIQGAAPGGEGAFRIEGAPGGNAERRGRGRPGGAPDGVARTGEGRPGGPGGEARRGEGENAKSTENTGSGDDATDTSSTDGAGEGSTPKPEAASDQTQSPPATQPAPKPGEGG